jgi:acyl carrier protein
LILKGEIQMEEIISAIKKTIESKTGTDTSEMSDTDSLKGDLGMDDLDILEVVMELEDEFDTELNDDEVESALTIEDLAKLIKGKV